MKARIRQRLEDRWAGHGSQHTAIALVSPSEDTFDEKHFTFDKLAEKWGLSHETVRRSFRSEAGVIQFGGVYRIPESVARRVYI